MYDTYMYSGDNYSDDNYSGDNVITLVIIVELMQSFTTF